MVPTLIALGVLSIGSLSFVVVREEMRRSYEGCRHLLRPILRLVELLQCR